jgi:hypothetical protein
VKCERVHWYIVVSDGKTKLIYSTNTQQVALLKEYTKKTYYVHYSCFTSICDLFTDSPCKFLIYLFTAIITELIILHVCYLFDIIE